MLAKPDTRWGAFGIHLAISALIFIMLACIIVFIWYPGFLFRTDGGWQGMRLIAGIDLVLGPLLTLLVYNKAKASLTADLTIIAVVQVTALTAGCYLVYQERPIAVIYADNKFSTLSHNSFAFYGLDPEEIPLLSKSKKPVWIYAQAPSNLPGESEAETFKRLGPQHLRTSNYQPFAQHAAQLRGRGQWQVDGHKNLTGDNNSQYFKMISRYFEGYLLFDFVNLKVIDVILTNSTDIYAIKQS